MGGGEVARYIGKHGTERVSQAVFISAVPPFLLKTSDSQSGVEQSVFDGIKQAIAADRPGFLSQFLQNFYNVDKLGGKLISDDYVRLSWNVAVGASPKGTLDCVSAWYTDFRKDLPKVDVPALVIHGDSDRIVPIDASGRRTHEMLKGSRLVVLQDAPHGLLWTHADGVNAELLKFLK
jgi:pimeloyl-ACP methyl ester carboxylesterase